MRILVCELSFYASVRQDSPSRGRMLSTCNHYFSKMQGSKLEVALCAGHKERVSRPDVTEAARFAKYAIAAYGAAGFQYLHQTS